VIAWLKADFPVTYLCEKLGVSRSAFYDWAASRTTPTARRRAALTTMVIEEFAVSNGVSGYRKVTAAIHRRSHPVNRKTIAVIMSELGLMAPAARRQFKRASRRRAFGKDPADLLLRDFASVTPGAVLVGDITYVPTAEGWLYVATVIDLASRCVLGFATGTRQTTDLIIRAMTAARKSGLIRRSTIFHSDHGTQYRSKRFSKYCRRAGIRRSMGARMQCWDNAAAESFFSKLKSERLDWITFATRQAAVVEVIDYVAHFNSARLHQTLGYKTPNERLAELRLAA
jgi:transposase InsO family protein